MIVLDASAAILLAKAELLDIFFHDAGKTVLMPREVQEECCCRDSLDARLIARAIEDKRIQVRVVERHALQRLIGDLGLGKGEAAAILLAVPKNAPVATDDKRAINACKLLKVPFTTTISLLVHMRRKRLVGRKEALEKLAALARHGHYKREIIEAARTELEI